MPPGRHRVRFLSNRGANGIDGLVSTAAGASLASGARTWAVLGDLALVHDLGGLASARAAKELRLIVIDNGGGGIFHFLPQADALPEPEFEALLGTRSGLDLHQALSLFGFDAVGVRDAAGLAEALRADARAVILTVDRPRNLELHRRLADAAAAALDPA